MNTAHSTPARRSPITSLVEHATWADEAQDSFNPISHLAQARAFLEAAELEAVTAARAAGYSWAMIAQAAGTTRQAAQQRWASKLKTCTCSEPWCPVHDVLQPVGAVDVTDWTAQEIEDDHLRTIQDTPLCPVERCSHTEHNGDFCEFCGCDDRPTSKQRKSRTPRRSESILDRAERITASRN